MFCIITTCSVECYWHCSEETVHYKSDKIVNFCGFRCATSSPITVFINFVFLHLSRITLNNLTFPLKDTLEIVADTAELQ